MVSEFPNDIAPFFRKLITALPEEALDAMERLFREGGKSRAIKLVTMDILTEKMKRQIN